MANVKVLNMQGAEVSSLELSNAVFGQEWNDQIIYDVVKAQRAAMRQGSKQTLNRSDVSGGGRKPYRQKGTGHARQGTIRAPQYRGGGHVFELHTRDFSFSVNKKVRQQALRIALSEKLANGNLIVVDNFTVEEIKTKAVVNALNAMNAQGKTLIVVSVVDEKLDASVNNIPTAAACLENHVSVYDVLDAKTLVLTTSAVKYYEEVLANE